MTVNTRILPFNADAIAQASELVRAGEPVAIASETVYGLAADATSGEAVGRVYAAKGRPAFNPLIVHVVDLAAVEAIAILSPAAARLAHAFWPGPLTMVLPLKRDHPIASLANAGLATVAIRIPAHPAMRALIKASGRPLAAPSANASGRISPTHARHVLASLAGRIPLIIDAGPTLHGLESTIVAVSETRLVLLRPGPVDQAALAQIAMLPVDIASGKEPVSAPGQLASHYAPAKPLRLDAYAAGEGEWLIGFGAIAGDENLSVTGNLIEAASGLFDALHRADATRSRSIAVAPIPSDGLGGAINDRLARAAAPRSRPT
jgi:L-threonylcarbamoyladenylate synthase